MRGTSHRGARSRAGAMGDTSLRGGGRNGPSQVNWLRRPPWELSERTRGPLPLPEVRRARLREPAYPATDCLDRGNLPHRKGNSLPKSPIPPRDGGCAAFRSHPC